MIISPTPLYPIIPKKKKKKKVLIRMGFGFADVEDVIPSTI